MDLKQVDLGAILPQQEPFRFVDGMLSFSMDRIVTSFVVRGDGPLDREGCLTPEGMVENMAQTCAARIGFISKYILHEPVSIGYLVSVRKLEVTGKAATGSRLETTVEIEQEVGPMSRADACIRVGEETVARASLGIATTERTMEEPA